MSVREMLKKVAFQFQCGAIEGQTNKMADLSFELFQFQCGAIEG